MPASNKSETLADRAYDAIADAIVRGELPPGARISEAALATRFQISRGPLREALRRLEGRRLVITRPNAGARVVSLSRRDMIELFDIRELLETRACQLATERMLDAEIDALEALLDAPDYGTGPVRVAEMADFHAAIVRGSKNKQLINLLCTELWGLLRISRVQAGNEISPAEACLREHRAIVEAMRQRDTDRAALLMGRHIRKARTNLLRIEGPAPPISSDGDIEDQAIGEIHLGPFEE